jgi:hypothetical protein
LLTPTPASAQRYRPDEGREIAHLRQDKL